MNTALVPNREAGVPGSLMGSKFSPSGRHRGSALIAAMITVVAVTAVVGVTFVSTTDATRMGGRAKDFASTQQAAEAAVEYGYGIWKRRIFIANGAISTLAANASLVGSRRSRGFPIRTQQTTDC